MASDDHSEASLTVVGAVAALAAIGEGGTWRGPWPDPALGFDAAGAQVVASLLRAGHAVPAAVTGDPTVIRVWTTLGFNPSHLGSQTGAPLHLGAVP